MSGVKKPILCLDWDGVIHSYTSGWLGATVIPDPLVDGAIEFLQRAVAVFEVHIHSSRSAEPGGIEAMQDKLRKHVVEHYNLTFAGSPGGRALAEDLLEAIKWPTTKPPAFVTLDDRAVTFTGTWPDVAALRTFKPWNLRK